MNRALLTIAVLAAAASLGVAATAIGSTPPTVHTAKSSIGRLLVDSHGRTLYLFEKDMHGRSSCSGMCATYWPPALVKAKPTAGATAKASLLGTTRRSNGAKQLTYNGHPLYRYSGDTRAGQTHGEAQDAFGAEWYALNAAGNKIDRD